MFLPPDRLYPVGVFSQLSRKFSTNVSLPKMNPPFDAFRGLAASDPRFTKATKRDLASDAFCENIPVIKSKFIKGSDASKPIVDLNEDHGQS